MIRGTSNKRLVASLVGAPRFCLGLAASLVALLLAARDVRWFQVGRALSQADALWLSLALGTFLLTTWLKAVRWRLLLCPQHSRLSHRVCLSVLMVGQLANNVLPARSGDLIRAIHTGTSHGTGRMLALATVVVEKALGSVMLLLLMGVLSLRVSMPPWLRHSGIAIGGVLAVSLLVWIVAVLTNTLVARSIDLPIDVNVASPLPIVLMVGAILPASPLQLGVFHYLCILTFALFEVDRSTAMTYAVLLHMVVFLPIVLGGVAGLWLETLTLHEPGFLRGRKAS